MEMKEKLHFVLFQATRNLAAVDDLSQEVHLRLIQADVQGIQNPLDRKSVV